MRRHFTNIRSVINQNRERGHLNFWLVAGFGKKMLVADFDKTMLQHNSTGLIDVAASTGKKNGQMAGGAHRRCY